jgi:glutaredoxin 3
MLGWKIYGKPNCQGCEQAKALLESKGIGYEYVDVMKTPSAQALFREKGFRSVPQIFLNGEHLEGGFEGLKNRLEEM